MVVYLVDAEADVDGLVLGLPDSENAVAVAEVLVVELTVVEAFELVSDHTLGVVLDALHHLADEVYAVLFGEGLDSDGAAVVGGDLGTEVSSTLLGGADIGKDQVVYVPV